MKRRWLCAGSLVIWLVGGCADEDADSALPAALVGATGLPLTSYMDELSEAHRRTFCSWQSEHYPSGSAPCGDSSYQLPSLDACAQSSTAFAHVQVEVAEACIEDVRAQGDVCTMPDSDACREVALAREAKAPNNGSCSSDRWANSRCATPDYY